MKKLFAFAIAASIFTFSATAQTDRVMKTDDQKQERHMGKHKQKGQMKKELNLSNDQGQKLKAINQDMKAKREALKAQDQLTVREMKARKEALKNEHKAQISSVLNAEQRAKMEEMKKQKMANKGMKGNRGQHKMKKNRQQS